LFTSLDEVREITHQWLQSYNEERPHDALGSLPPVVFRERLLAGKNSTSDLST
jgi:putative transposase